jgi:proline dehydrogenase
MISIEPLVKIGSAVTNFALNINLPVEGLIRATVFDHFCGGINVKDCLSVVDKMHTKGVSSVLIIQWKEKRMSISLILQ